MSFTLVINSSNNVNPQTNTSFKYPFLGGNFDAKDMEMCVSALAVPYSWFNVSSFYNNQSFSLIFPTGIATGALTYTLNITLPAGFYQVSDIQNYIQNQCIAQGLYLVNSSSQNVYYFTIATNVTYYTTQIVCSPVPTSLPVGYTYAASGKYSSSTGLPATGYTSQFVLPTSAGINTLIGWTAGTYPAAQQTTIYTGLGTVTPIGSTVNSVTLRCNILRNDVTVPSDILDNFPINATFGSNITYTPSFEKWIPISNGTYSNLALQMVDQNLNSIVANDSNVSITLLIRKRPKA